METNIEEKKRSSFDSNDAKAPSFQTYFKKLDPPIFSGDCLDYIEWKTKWAPVVSTCKQPESFQLDHIKENIPEKA